MSQARSTSIPTTIKDPIMRLSQLMGWSITQTIRVAIKAAIKIHKEQGAGELIEISNDTSIITEKYQKPLETQEA